ncbi:hypothetical protein ICN11_04900 [Polynucleobacter sp. 78F-HAINBA]|uniref:hypothetical protein n=1 Tax=Polynucleobacter sp. 78F-HAINBA TaxID=2689099 RepID=UPI002105B6CE|nr:hypothetical protein [Polynucleobacter sp. 78F-HAINBA]MBU3591353.1 hypothetical protein [Polynucleobacter sp. 78F-HAINBA]
MKIIAPMRIATLFFVLALLSACTVDKLEARLQADPECKPIMNAKTGALMPCPGTDKQFYKSIPALNVSAPKATPAAVTQSSSAAVTPSPKAATAPVECKPQLHQKSGTLMPCPAP